MEYQFQSNPSRQDIEKGCWNYGKGFKKAIGQMGRGSEIVTKTEQVRNNVKVQESTGFLKTQEMDNKPINIWTFVMTRFMGKNSYKICQ